MNQKLSLIQTLPATFVNKRQTHLILREPIYYFCVPEENKVGRNIDKFVLEFITPGSGYLFSSGRTRSF